MSIGICSFIPKHIRYSCCQGY